MTDSRQNAGSTRGRPFQPGNPGRREGSRNKATVILDALADGEAEEILRKLVGAAKDGDLKAAEIILSRVWPVRKNRTITLDLPPVLTAAGVLAGVGAVIDAAARAEITPDEAATLANMLELKRRAIETVEIEQRLAALERSKK